MKIVIIGAGIGGLLTALSLHEAGFDDIEIYERSKRIRGLGVGINLLPHAVREITELGLYDEISELGVKTSTLSYYNKFGQKIWSEPRGLDAGYQWPQISVHRGRLQLALAEAVEQRIGDVIRTGHKVVSVEDGATSSTAIFATDRREVVVDADLIIAADGIHSTVRVERFPEEGAPPRNGYTMWRGIAYAAPILDGATMVMVGDDEQRFVAYPIQKADPSGRMLINIIAEKRGGISDVVHWSHAIDPQPIIDMFAGWSVEGVDIPGLLSTIDELLEYPVIDRDPLPQWTVGRTTLLGDAAHAMRPNGSNGGSQATMDARTLAYHLATTDSVDEGLRRYEEARRPLANNLLREIREGGPERVMTFARERAPEGFSDIHDVVSVEELEEVALSFKRAAGIEPLSLNARASLSVPKQANGLA